MPAIRRGTIASAGAGVRADLPVSELAELLGVSVAVLVAMCRFRAGRFFFLGARQEKGGEWMIPARSVARALAVADVGFYLRPVEAAAVLGLSVAQVQRMVRAGSLPGLKLPGLNDVRIPAAALTRASLESHKERKDSPGMHSEAGAAVAKGGEAVRGAVAGGPARRGRARGARGADAGPAGRAKWYATAFPAADNHGVAAHGGGCGGNSCEAGRDQKGGGGGSGRGPGAGWPMDQ